MITSRACLLAGFLPGVPPFLCAAELSNDAVIAAMNVGRGKTYSWTTVSRLKTVTPGGRDGVRIFQGQTEVGGFTRVRVVNELGNPVISGIGGDLISDRIDAVFLGSNRGAVSTERGWMTFPELPSAETQREQQQELRSSMSRLNAAGNSSSPSLTPRQAADESRQKEIQRQLARAIPPRNLELSIRLPHQDMEAIVAGSSDFRKTTDGFRGTLSDTAGRHFATRFGVSDPEIIRVSGEYQCIVQNGSVTSYDVTLQITYPLAGDREWTRELASHTEIRDVGSTTVTVPDAARAKLAE